jgi:uncharacterized protein
MRSDPDPRAFLGRGWAFPVAAGADGSTVLAAYEEDVAQAIRIVIGTEKGERVMRPDFGAGLRAMLFEPLSTTTLALIRHRVEEALVTWEPRIDNVAVKVGARPPEGEVCIEVRYRVRLTNTFYNLVYPFLAQELRR